MTDDAQLRRSARAWPISIGVAGDPAGEQGEGVVGGGVGLEGPALYVILAPGATQVACPDGTLRHDHVLSGLPGTSGYTGAWTIVLAVPGPAFDVTDMPYTSVAKVESGVAAGELTLVETGIVFVAPVVGGR